MGNATGIPVIVLIFLIAFGISYYGNSASASTSAGIMIPLYKTPPNPSWDAVFSDRIAHPDVPMIVIVNPASGPGTRINTNYVSVIKQLQGLGVSVLGYVHTNYGTRNYTSMTSDMSAYKDWYNVNGTFFDQMSVNTSEISLYSNLTNYSRSIGLDYTVGNPGLDTIPGYIGTVNNIVIYENSGLPEISSLGGWHTSYPKQDFTFLSYGMNSTNKTAIEEASNFVGYMYVTNGTLPNPWNKTSPILENLSSAIPPSATLGIKSNDLLGKLISGISVQVDYLGGLLFSGQTPASFSLSNGSQYQISLSQNFGNYTFSKWQDACSCKAARNYTLTGNDTLVALYDGPCVPPALGDWNIGSSCTLGGNSTASGNVIVTNDSVLTIPDNTRLVIDFLHYHLLVRSGSGVLVRAGGAIN